MPLKLDVTSQEDVVAAARVAGDVNLLINNAGIARPGGFLADGAVEAAREQFEVNFVGPLRMSRAFAPVLAKNGGGAIINVLSVASWMNGPRLATYGASKSAAWALTNGLRIELAQQATQVVGLHAGFIDTDLARNIDAPKSSPEEIVRATLEALERGDGQVLADEITRPRAGLPLTEPAHCPFNRGSRRLISSGREAMSETGPSRSMAALQFFGRYRGADSIDQRNTF
jgi:NAD(P)-dependent dehydrogenase (short-subunit alcohol dehydrogenase family)